jgi:hypothetical protein
MLTPQISAFAEQAAAHLSQFALKTARAQATWPANWPPAVTAIRSLIFSISSSCDETHTTAAPASPDAMVPAGNAWLVLSREEIDHVHNGSIWHVRARRPRGEAAGLWRHAARRPRRVWPAQRS